MAMDDTRADVASLFSLLECMWRRVRIVCPRRDGWTWIVSNAHTSRTRTRDSLTPISEPLTDIPARSRGREGRARRSSGRSSSSSSSSSSSALVDDSRRTCPRPRNSLPPPSPGTSRASRVRPRPPPVVRIGSIGSIVSALEGRYARARIRVDDGIRPRRRPSRSVTTETTTREDACIFYARDRRRANRLPRSRRAWNRVESRGIAFVRLTVSPRERRRRSIRRVAVDSIRRIARARLSRIGSAPRAARTPADARPSPRARPRNRCGCPAPRRPPT